MNTKLTVLLAGMALSIVSLSAFAEESHISQALTHAEAAAKATDGTSIAKHAELAKTHAEVIKEHLDAGMKSLDTAIDEGKQDHTDLAKKAAEEAVTHLKAAQ